MLSLSEIQIHLNHPLEKILWGLIILFLSLTIAKVLKFIFIKYRNKSEKSGNFGRYAFFQTITNPLFTLLLWIGYFFALNALDSFPFQNKYFILVSIKLPFIICTFWFLTSFLNILDKKFQSTKEKNIGKLDKTTASALIKLGKALVLLITITFTLDIFDIDIRGILTVAGIGGAAIGFAAKDMIANFFGAIMLFIDKPFTIGDYVKLSNGKEGEVEYIGWRVTKLRATDTTCTYIANSLFSNMSVENQSMRTHRRILQKLKLKYSDINKLEAVTKEVRTALSKSANIDNKKRIDCFLLEFSDSSVTCEISAFTKTIDKLEFAKINQKIMIEILKIISKHKLKVAFPIIDIHK